jgi:hypothetical protein
MVAGFTQELNVPSEFSIPSSRRDFLKQSSLAGLAAALPAATLFGSAHPVFAAALKSGADSSAVKNRVPLAASAFYFLPLGSIRPAGWLRGQLEVQANGLSGHLDETWADVGPSSGWLGGTGESWERGPYFLDGLVPLAWLLEDARLKAKAQKYIEWTLTHLAPNGMIGPATNDDWWPRFVMLKVLTQYQELSGDARVIPAMEKYFEFQLGELPHRPLRDWGKFRWQDEVLSVIWLYNRTGKGWLLDLARLLHKQGYDWMAQYADFKYTQRVTPEFLKLEEGNGLKDPDLATHGVNNGQAVKTGPVWSLVSGNSADRRTVHRGGIHVFAGTLAGHFGRCGAGRPAGAAGLQRAARYADRRHVGAPVQPGAEPGGVQPAPQALGERRAGIEPLWPGTELRLLHGELSPGLAEVCEQPVSALGRAGFGNARRAGRRGLCAVRSAHGAAGHGRSSGGRDGLSLPRHGQNYGESRYAADVSAGASHSGLGRGDCR